MSLTRRRLFQQLGTSAAATPLTGEWVAARGREDAVATGAPELGRMAAARATVIKISSNENPLGPGAHVLDAIVGKFPEAGRYPFNAKQPEGALVKALRDTYSVGAENISLGAGSGEILTNAVRAFTSPTRPLVTAWPSFENPHTTAKKIGTPIREVPLDGTLGIDIDKMVEMSKGAGLVFFCNPNNPTATVHGAEAVNEFVRRVRQAAPDAVILLDEAYHDYVTNPAYKTGIPLAMSTPNVFVARTFSKAYGMAGLRLGYAIGDKATIAALNKFRMPFSLSVPTLASGITAIGNPAHIADEARRNTQVKAYTMKAFADMGFEATDSQTNFIFVNLRRPAAAFRDACREHGVLVGRDFPPYEKTHCRISIGTMEEMQTAVGVFKKVLGASTTTAQQGR